MPIIYTLTDIFDSPARTLVNPCNIKGIAGAGLSKRFRETFPKEMHVEYVLACRQNSLKSGDLWIWNDDSYPKEVLFFPTKIDVWKPSQTSYIEKGLIAFRNIHQRFPTISFPKLGCGLGSLSFERDLLPLLNKHLAQLTTTIWVHIGNNDTQYLPSGATVL